MVRVDIDWARRVIGWEPVFVEVPTGPSPPRNV